MALQAGLPTAGTGTFLPLNKPILEPNPRARAIKQEPLKEEPIKHRFSPGQLQKFLYNLPQTILNKSKSGKNKPTTTTTSTTQRPFSTTSQYPIRPMKYKSKPSYQRRVATFHWNDFNKGSDVTNNEESGIVFMVGVFNLLAVVVYAAYRHISGEPALSDRVITWQVQKVLDELVLRVHSSDYASELLSRSLPNGMVMEARSLKKDPLKWLQFGITTALQNPNDINGLQKWLENLKHHLITEVAGSEAARNSIRLNPIIYRPMKMLYARITKKKPEESNRAMDSPMINEVGAALVALGQLSVEQTETALRTLTKLDGLEVPNENILPILEGVLNNAITDKNHQIKKRSLVNEHRHNTIAAALASSLTHAYAQNHNSDLRNSRNTRPMNLPVGYNGWGVGHDRRVNSKYSHLRLKPRHRMVDLEKSNNFLPQPQKLTGLKKSSKATTMYHRTGIADQDTSVNHWTDRWFSLVTTLAPVGLDITTLYARAKARPSCLKSLLCQTNNAWKRVGAVQAAVTPFLSVLVSWSLEDMSPHSLGDSLIAIRAGWMGKDCAALYHQCTAQPAPHPAAKEAATFLNKLESVATQPPMYVTSAPIAKEITSVPEIAHNNIDRIDLQNEYDFNSDFKQTKTRFENSNGGQLKEFYERYGGQGPMTVPGNQAYLNYQEPHRSGEVEKKQVDLHQNQNLPYKRYDSPKRNDVLEGSITGSNSVSGMALQDRHRAKSPPIGMKSPSRERYLPVKPQTPPDGNAYQPVWNHFSKAGLYGGNVKQDEQNHSPQEKPQSKSPPSKINKSNRNGIYQTIPINKSKIGSSNSKINRNIQGKHKTIPSRPYFTLQPTKKYRPTPGYQTTPQKKNQKYRYGLRRGLPASNVNGYNSYHDPVTKMYPPTKKWHSYSQGHRLSQHKPAVPSTSTKPTTTTTTSTPSTTSTTTNPLKEKDVAQFGPQDAVTDVLRNKMLFEYVRDRQGSIPLTNRRSLFK